MIVMTMAFWLVRLIGLHFTNLAVLEEHIRTEGTLQCKVNWRMRVCQNTSDFILSESVVSLIAQGLSTMTRGSQRQRASTTAWTWVPPSSSCTRPCGAEGTARDSLSPSLSSSCPPGRTTQTTSNRSASPSPSNRSGRPNSGRTVSLLNKWQIWEVVPQKRVIWNKFMQVWFMSSGLSSMVHLIVYVKFYSGLIIFLNQLLYLLLWRNMAWAVQCISIPSLPKFENP